MSEARFDQPDDSSSLWGKLNASVNGGAPPRTSTLSIAPGQQQLEVPRPPLEAGPDLTPGGKAAASPASFWGVLNQSVRRGAESAAPAATPATAFGRGGVDEQLMGHPQIDIYRSTGDQGMVRQPPDIDAGIERRFDPFARPESPIQQIGGVEDPRRPGSHLVIPTLWLKNGKPTILSEDQAADEAIKSGLNFQTFATEQAAKDFAEQRESKWQEVPEGRTDMQPALWTQATPDQQPQTPAAKPEGGSFWDKLKGLVPDLTGGPETGGLRVTPQTAPVFEKGAELVKGGIAGATGLPSAIEQFRAASEKEPVYQPGMKAGQMMPKEWQQNPALYVYGAGSLGRGPGIPGQRTTPLPPGQPPGAADLARGISHFIETNVSPTTADFTGEMAEMAINKGLGQARQKTAQAFAQITNDMHRLVGPQMGEFEQYVADIHQYTNAGQPIPPHTKPQALRFIDYVEGRSKGAQLDPDIAHMQELADTLRQIVQDRQRAIAADPLTNVTSFVEDYFSHQWAEKTRVPTLLYGTRPRMGSGTALHQRKIPTISEGIDAGLTPTSFNPIETTMRYVANMDRFLAANEIFATGKSAGLIKFFAPGKQPDGWVPLEGRLAKPPFQQAYAPEGFARVYNRSAHVDPGWVNAPAFQAWNHAKNAFTQTLLGFSGYHYMAMMQESAASMFGKSLGSLSEGEIAQAAKQAGLATTIIGPAIRNLAKGTKVQKAYLSQLIPNDPTALLYKRVADLLASTGGRVIGRGEEWRGTAKDDFWTAWKRGTLGPELGSEMHRIVEGPLATAPLRAAGTFFREVGRIMETVNRPLFDLLVPKLKGAAFFDEMSDWLHANPNASRAEELTAANQFWTAIDDRFGEMVMDRIFWNQKFKQVLQSVMVSPGWEIGSARAIGGGLADIDRGQWTTRSRWVIGFITAAALADGAYQYFKTGKPPQSYDDIFLPRTGGTAPGGAEERAIQPGYEKDPLGFWKDPIGKIFGMQNPAVKFAREIFTGKDSFTGRPIVQDFPGAPPWLTQWGKHMLRNYSPIPLQQYLKGGEPGTHIGVAENILGIRSAPGWIVDPQRAHALERAASLAETVRSLSSQMHTAQRKDDREEVQKLARERALAIAERKRLMGGVTQREQERKRAAPPTVTGP